MFWNKKTHLEVSDQADITKNQMSAAMYVQKSEKDYHPVEYIVNSIDSYQKRLAINEVDSLMELRKVQDSFEKRVFVRLGIEISRSIWYKRGAPAGILLKFFAGLSVLKGSGFF